MSGPWKNKRRLAAHLASMRKKANSPEANRKRAATLAARCAAHNPEKGTPHVASNEQQILSDHLVGYAFGHVEAWLQIYAASHRVPVASLAHRVGALLQAASRR